MPAVRPSNHHWSPSQATNPLPSARQPCRRPAPATRQPAMAAAGRHHPDRDCPPHARSRAADTSHSPHRPAANAGGGPNGWRTAGGARREGMPAVSQNAPAPDTPSGSKAKKSPRPCGAGFSSARCADLRSA
jgi:hypothetical protein